MSIKFYSFILILGVNATVFAQSRVTEARIDQLIAQMTIEEKAGEMTQLAIDMVCFGDPYNIKEPNTIDPAKLKQVIQDYHVGSILNTGAHGHSKEWWQDIVSTIQKEAQKTRLKIPVLYGIDAIHGVTYTTESTLFPQPLGMAATWNTALTTDMASITAYETRACGIPWTFSPAMDLCRYPVWSRTWESFGEDVYMNRMFGKAMVEGYQGTDMSDKTKIAACMKHFTGYGAAVSGKDRTPAWVPERMLQEYYLPQYQEAINAGAMTIMICSGEMNGIPVHADKHILADILRGQLGFKGLAVSDWGDIAYLYTRHHVAKDYKESIKMAINAGIDMAMVPTDLDFTKYLIELAKEGSIPMSRMDEAVRRILRVKLALGLFEKPIYPLNDYPKFGSGSYRDKSLQAASESVILLKNKEGILPLPKTAKALVVGPTANSMRSLNGGWTYTWQGDQSDKILESKNTIVEGIEIQTGRGRVTHIEAASQDKLLNIDDAIRAAATADYIILCLGETSYTETPGGINDLNLEEAQVKLALEMAKTGKPIVLVLAEGRPRLISKIEDKMGAIVLSLFTGPEGGDAIAKVLYGEVNPSGKLPLTYPRYANGIVPYDRKSTESFDDPGFPQGKDAYYNPQFEFGFGLSYTTFGYKNLSVGKRTFGMNDPIQISVEVTNTGKVEGMEVVQLYTKQLVASITPSERRLRGFQKVSLKPGETKTVQFKLTSKDLAFVGLDNKFVTEAGEFKAMVGGLDAPFELK